MVIELPEGVAEWEVNLLLSKFFEVKKRRYGGIEVAVVDAKLVDVTMSLRENHSELKKKYA